MDQITLDIILAICGIVLIFAYKLKTAKRPIIRGEWLTENIFDMIGGVAVTAVGLLTKDNIMIASNTPETSIFYVLWGFFIGSAGQFAVTLLVWIVPVALKWAFGKISNVFTSKPDKIDIT